MCTGNTGIFTAKPERSASSTHPCSVEFKLLAAKDVRLATDLGREYGIPMELSNLVAQRHVEALFRGYGPEDSDAVAKIQEEKSGIQLRLHN